MKLEESKVQELLWACQKSTDSGKPIFLSDEQVRYLRYVLQVILRLMWDMR